MHAKVKLLFDFMHRLSIHHSMWFNQVETILGKQQAFLALKKCAETTIPLQASRLAKTLNISLNLEDQTSMASGNLQINEAQLLELTKAVAVNWLANDGIWFQAIESVHGMTLAKRCNDTCWEKFSPFEAWSIKNLIDLPENAGLDGLASALSWRLYAYINKQSMVRPDKNTLLFYMNDCRVQNARQKKGLADYPCKSAGVIEYTSFAKAIDSKIKTECISCPPDNHPTEWFCGWKFTIPN
ncbi:MAG: cytosolic protein [Bdellovibrionales bacterium RIFOXYD12_FULL_39_22]|nr:MAG: cytosolic protein [Bdellovibrionales bacterium RIFOXYB1_FULL_39_21]OFZ42868.1 MAG: cytosolic protein [Bdellovibrionales bacterium RIFOXYC12_FULL_39_17]OFZ47472.1 MAG: cytosolic protein [Bdellovibrionales bacterium RIFOXYC1_FULL_39_130]OFZ71621.1 MAG: cytosolic protein [Bdellovibrionales bacterium RIFOXYC2_FULL_39_8]OFZ75560.1 MAG: cytosolic protein [Bdellovibrionales bacterium RIFOXYD1_FULL_39_84]OFZ93883.1 MAG: cytosolic protein [Bdellovibrionales bacterium RIFOXYD12_FULL_39_22]HLE10